MVTPTVAVWELSVFTGGPTFCGSRAARTNEKSAYLIRGWICTRTRICAPAAPRELPGPSRRGGLGDVCVSSGRKRSLDEVPVFVDGQEHERTTSKSGRGFHWCEARKSSRRRAAHGPWGAAWRR